MVAEGFEPSKRDASDLKSLPFDQTRERYQKPHVGLEPTTFRLEVWRAIQLRQWGKFPTPGLEPGSAGWKPAILTI